MAAAALAAFLLCTLAADFDSTLDPNTRADIYNPLVGSAAALLGFVLAALAILVALPSTERIEKLRQHPRWNLVPSSYFRGARALLASLILCLLGIPLDSAADPWVVYEALVVVVLSLAIVRTVAAVVALDQIVAVAQADQRGGTARPQTIDDPGP